MRLAASMPFINRLLLVLARFLVALCMDIPFVLTSFYVNKSYVSVSRGSADA
jgi:hypothetical protein